MEYELGGKKFSLRNICGKNLKVCKELGFLNTGNLLTQEDFDLIKEALDTGEDGKVALAQEVLKRNPMIDTTEVLLNPLKLTKLLDAVFITTPEELKYLRENWDDLNSEIIINATYELLKKCQPSSLTLEESLKILTNLMMKTANSQT